MREMHSVRSTILSSWYSSLLFKPRLLSQTIRKGWPPPNDSQSANDVVDRLAKDGGQADPHRRVRERVLVVATVGGPWRVVGVDSGRRSRVLLNRWHREVSGVREER